MQFVLHYNFEIELWIKLERVGVGGFSFCRIYFKKLIGNCLSKSKEWYANKKSDRKTNRLLSLFCFFIEVLFPQSRPILIKSFGELKRVLDFNCCFLLVCELGLD